MLLRRSVKDKGYSSARKGRAMKRFLVCLFIFVSISLFFAALESAGASESGICSDVSQHNMPLDNALIIGNISAPRKVIAFIDPN